MSLGRGGLRRMARAPGLSLAVVATLALGVGASTALFVYLNAFLFPVLSAVDPERLVQVHFGTREEPTASASYDEFRALAEARVFEAISATFPAGTTVASRGQTQFAWGRAVTPGFFPIFGARATLGRLLVESDESPVDAAPIVLSHRLWRGLFHADPDIVGREIELNGSSYTVVGVIERGFQGVGFASEWFVPLREIDRLSGVARLADPTAKFLPIWALVPRGSGGRERAESALAGVARGLDAATPLPDAAARVPMLEPATLFGSSYEEDPYYLAARMLVAASIVFLLLGASNVAGLLLARATARDHEWAVRQAMGASPVRLAAAIVLDLVPMALLGLGGAAALAHSLLRWIEGNLVLTVGGLGSTWAIEEPRFLRLDARAAAFALVATALALGIAAAAPLARVLRRRTARVLNSGTGRVGTDRATLAPRRLLVVSEIALAFVLLVGGALLARTLNAYAAADPGFETSGLALATVFLPPSAEGPAANAEFYRALVARTRELPGIADASLANVAPNSGWSRSAQAAPAEKPEGGVSADYNVVGAGYLTTLGVPMLAGRDLDLRDLPDSTPVVVVSRALATALWGEPSAALGRRLRIDLPARPGQAGPEFEVVGVSADAGVTSPAQPARPWAFFAYGQRTMSRMQLVLRTALPPSALEPLLRDTVTATNAQASLVDLVSAPEQHRRALQSPRMNAQLAGILALAGLATALVGLVALQTFTVHLRRRDFAVRMAFGATGRRVTREVLRESLGIAGAGVVLGAVAALGVSRLLRGLLFGVGALDPVSFLGVPLILVAAVALASWLPARRAARVDPAENLRTL